MSTGHVWNVEAEPWYPPRGETVDTTGKKEATRSDAAEQIEVQLDTTETHEVVDLDSGVPAPCALGDQGACWPACPLTSHTVVLPPGLSWMRNC